MTQYKNSSNTIFVDAIINLWEAFITWRCRLRFRNMIIIVGLYRIEMITQSRRYCRRWPDELKRFSNLSVCVVDDDFHAVGVRVKGQMKSGRPIMLLNWNKCWSAINDVKQVSVSTEFAVFKCNIINNIYYKISYLIRSFFILWFLFFI